MFLNVLGIFVVFISYCWTYPYPLLHGSWTHNYFYFTCIHVLFGWRWEIGHKKLCLRRGLFIGYCMWLDSCWKGKVNVFVLPWDWLLFSWMKNIWFTCYLLTVPMTHVALSPRLHFWGIHANEVSALQAATILFLMVRRNRVVKRS